MVKSKDITIIGAGFVGIIAAVRLIEDGHKVTLIDRVGPGNGASHGNAGAVVQNHAEPIADPSIFKDIPQWLLDPHGPLALRWQHLPALAPWLGRFLLEGRASRYHKNASALQQLSQYAVPRWNDLVRGTTAQELLKPVGWLKLYKTEETWKKAKTTIDSCDKFRTDYEILSPDEIRQLEPNFAPVFHKGIFQPASSFVCSPQKMLDNLFERFLSKGGKFVKGNVSCLTPQRHKPIIHFDNATEIEASDLLIAAGGWSNKILKTIGQSVHLQVERGYHVMIPHADQGPLTSRPTMVVDHMFVLAPMIEGMRISGQSELAEIDSEPNYTRLYHLVEKAREVVPEMKNPISSKWMGPRPSQPDSIPTISPLPDYSHIMLAFGHHHLGVTLSAITGDIIANHYADRPQKIDMTPYRAFR